jgi:DNA polymerase III delta prime subunit
MVTEPIQPQSKKTDPSAQQATPQETTISDPPLSKASSGENQNARNPTILDSSNAGRSDKPPTVAAPGIGDAELLEVDLNHDRRKRKRTVSPRGDGERPSYQQQSLPNFLSKTMVNTIEANSVVTVIADEVPQEKSSDVDPERFLLVDKPPSTQTQQIRKTSAIDLSHVASISSRPDKLDQSVDGDPAYSSKEGPAATKTQAGNDETKPKRILRLNPKTGTIGSPPAKQKEPQIETVGRKARPSRSNQRISKFVIIRYGHGTNLPSELGTKIGKILRGSETVSSLTARSSTANEKSKNRKVIGANPGAAPHPFFLGKAAAKPSAAQEVILPVSDVTGIAQSKELMTLELAGSKPPKRPAPSKSSVSRFTGFGGNAAKILKFPGAVEPAWPWKGMTHVRGSNGILDGPQLPSNGLSGLLSRRKKSKYQAVEVLASEDVISALATELCITQLVKNVREINLDEYPPVAACLRIPDRHFASGRDIQERVRKELSTQLPAPKAHTEENTSEDEIQGTGFKHGLVHPALATIYNTISTSLSAFDQSRCETQSWCHKYSPKATAEVLQTGREVQIIKEWLQTLIVKSVETGVGDRSHSRASSVSRRSTATGKRKHRSKKLDGFVVSSDEEEDDLDEISETDEDASPHSSQGLLKRTVVRAGNAASKGSTRLTNAVVVSGPHGCGKTAAIYAVAKELGFEVFEINSSSRRSGKDILEKVGDMTHNHLVQGSHDQTLAEPVDEDARRIADALEDDLKSGRQGTMNSFFKPKESATAKSQPKVISTGTPKSGTSIFTAPPRASSRQQKQSLILFEEVDVLYDEDKQFWATVINMIAQSKRPVIMTCTDESTVPFISLTLHAIIRFTPPPIDLATDYMLLVAASEGHLIRREAVKALYESRRQDLRASLMELNFWCQFAVGDNKGGLEWLYTRWPPGVDIDDNGRIIRVISDSAYETGMGWLCQDFLESHLSHVDIEEETMHEAWEGWHLDVGDWRQTLNVSAWANKMQSQSRGKGDGANSLRIYDEFLDAISAADLCSGGTFAPDNEVSRLHNCLYKF